MEKSLYTGDKILVNKLAYGPRLPNSPYEIPWVNIGFVLCNKESYKVDSVWWKYERWNGYIEIKRNDIIVFDGPFLWGKMILVKRCIGLPGDTIVLSDGQILINGDTINQPGTIQYHCKYKTNNSDIINEELNKKGCIQQNFDFFPEDTVYQHTILTPDQIRFLSTNPLIDTIIVPVMDWQDSKKIFPNDTTLNWTWNEYGPITVPYKGMELILNDKSFKLYQKELTHFEKAGIEFINKCFYRNGKEIKSYTFKNNYYWMMGDNRNYSLDSREWGFVPEDHIIGKAWIVLFSINEHSGKLGRIFKKIK